MNVGIPSRDPNVHDTREQSPLLVYYERELAVTTMGKQ